MIINNAQFLLASDGSTGCRRHGNTEKFEESSTKSKLISFLSSPQLITWEFQRN